MIPESAIQQFDSETQKQIRASIAKHIENGRPVEFLLLNPDGSIMYDSEVHSDYVELTRRKDRDGRKSGSGSV